MTLWTFTSKIQFSEVTKEKIRAEEFRLPVRSRG